MSNRRKVKVAPSCERCYLQVTFIGECDELAVKVTGRVGDIDSHTVTVAVTSVRPG